MYNDDDKYQLMQAIIFFILGMLGLLALIVWASL
jgi:hypothetical protein